MSGRFEGKCLLATGAGSGLARATVERFTAEGGRVAVIDVDGDRAQAVAGELRGAVAFEADVADEAVLTAAVAAAASELGRIDCAFNAAGIADFGPIAEWSVERFERMMRIHMTGTFVVCREVTPIMRSGGGGSIVNVASVAALTAQPGNAPYGAAKAAIAGYTRQLAFELAPDIRVNAIAPGRVLSGMTEPLYKERGGGSLEAGMELAAQHNMLKRMGVASEIAGPACFLFSDDASFITGHLLVADGGETVLS
jgi:meso-butanediol dehydrogenase/(S,S)-butanediol dehydrogenase/diacetyl reductase